MSKETTQYYVQNDILQGRDNIPRESRFPLQFMLFVLSLFVDLFQYDVTIFLFCTKEKDSTIGINCVLEMQDIKLLPKFAELSYKERISGLR